MLHVTNFKTKNREGKYFYLCFLSLSPMPKGMSSARHDNIARATHEGKKVLLKTKNWQTTQTHLHQWLNLTYAVSYHTRRDYIDNVYSRLSQDPEVSDYLV